MTSLPLKHSRSAGSRALVDRKRANGYGLHRLIYLSRSRVLFTIHSPLAPLDGIIHSAAPRNKALRITGVLLYNGNYFAQVLEGLRRDVEAVFAAISNDPRHDEIMVLENGEITERTFAGWSVRYLDMADGTEVELCGVSAAEKSQESERQAASLIALLRYCVQTVP